MSASARCWSTIMAATRLRIMAATRLSGAALLVLFGLAAGAAASAQNIAFNKAERADLARVCLLYTSDAADE